MTMPCAVPFYEMKNTAFSVGDNTEKKPANPNIKKKACDVGSYLRAYQFIYPSLCFLAYIDHRS